MPRPHRVLQVRAAIYARVSTEDQASEGTSLDSQVERCRRRVLEDGWDAVGEYVDRGVSGSLSSRPALDQVVRLVEDHSIDVVVITKLDRIARSLRNLLELLDLFERHEVQLVALDDPLDPSTPSGKAFVHMRGVFAELERGLIRERITEGLKARVTGGGWPGGPPPYGYRVVPNPDGTGKVLVVDEEEAVVIRLAFRLIVEDGATTGEAANELRRFGSTPRRATEWTHWNLRRLLLDARGLSGEWPWRRAGRQGRTGDDEILVQVPPILSSTEHEALLATLRTTSTQPSGFRTYLLRGRLLSPHGTRMQGVPGNGSRWYRCPHRHSSRPTGVDRCDCHRLHAVTVERAVWSEIGRLLSDPAVVETLAAEHEGARDSFAGRERARLAELDAEIAAMEDRIAAEYIALVEDGIDPAAARAVVRTRNEQLSSLRSERDQLTRLRRHNLAAAGASSRLRTAAAAARSVLDQADDTLRRKLIDVLDVHVEVLGWQSCTRCAGRGLIRLGKSTEPSRRGRTGGICPECLRTRVIPLVRIGGQIPELLLAALSNQGEVTHLESARGDVVIPFSTEIEVA